MTFPDEVRRQARELIAARLGLDFPERRSADLDRALLRAASDSASRTLHEHLSRLAALPESDAEWRRLAAYLTVGETYFFRDAPLFEALERRVLPSIIEARRSERVRRLRLWSAGCATGEEPYSLAILVDRLLPDLADWSVTILATDVDVAALDIARQGRYREWSFRGTPEWVRDRYFRQHGSVLEVDRRIRRLVSLAPLNLSGESYPSPLTNTTAMDVVLCRNVLMYFTPDAQRATLERLRGALLDGGGYLALSAPETSVEGLQGFERVDVPGAVLYRQPSRLPAPAPPPSPRADAGAPAWPADAGGSAWEPTATVSLEPLVATGEQPATAAAPPLPGEREGVLAETRALADMGRLDEARRRCERAIAHDRLIPDAYLLLAAICQENGDVGGALDAVRRALYLAPDSAAAHFLQGCLLARQGQRLRARRSMETVVRLLAAVPPDERLPDAGDMAAGHLLESARTHLELA